MEHEALPKNIDWDAAADYYDAFVRTDFDVPFFLAESRAAGGPVLELMCGTGRLTLPLVASGADVAALDSSEGMLAKLRSKLAQRGLSARTVHADVRAFELGERFALVLIGFHAFAEVLGRSERLRALAAVREHVAPEGRVVLTLHNPPVRAASAHSEWRSMGTVPFEAGRRLEVSSRWDVDRAGARVSGAQRYRELDERGACVRELDLPIVFDLVTPAEIDALAEAVGLRVLEVLGDYDRRAFDPVASPFAIFRLAPLSP